MDSSREGFASSWIRGADSDAKLDAKAVGPAKAEEKVVQVQGTQRVVVVTLNLNAAQIWGEMLLVLFFFLFFLRWSFALVAQARVQWHNLSSL